MTLRVLQSLLLTSSLQKRQSVLFLIVNLLLVMSVLATSVFKDVDTSLLTSSQGLSFTSSIPSTNLGQSANRAGDINNDGIDDIILGGNPSSNGIVYVVYGKSHGLHNIDLGSTDLSGSQQGFTIKQESFNSGFGSSVGSAGDVNNDGIDDLIIGASGASSGKGAAYVIFGRDNGLDDIDLSSTSLSTTNKGFKIIGASAGDNFGVSVQSAGDVNNDGISDIIVGSNGAFLSTGAAYVVFGKTGNFADIDVGMISLYALQQGFMITGQSSSDNFGCSVAGAGDINNDGIDDLIIGAFFGSSYFGTAYVVFGSGAELTDIDLSTASLSSSHKSFMIKGPAYSSMLGFSVGSAGDINNDGIDDILVGAFGAFSYSGAAYVVFGKKNGLSDIDLTTTSLSSSLQGIQIKGASIDGHVGSLVGCAGDLNDDGIDDIIIGADNTLSGAGSAYVIFGRNNRMDDISLSVTNLSASGQGFQIVGTNDQNQLGKSASRAGDVNRDGVDDILIGAPLISSSAGVAYVIFGKKSGSIERTPSKLETATTLANVFENIADTAASVLCIGSSITVRTGFISKLIQDIRYLNITYSSQVQGILQTRKSRLLDMSLPVTISKQLISREIPAVFTKYGIKPSFLGNFWGRFIILAVVFAIWLVCVGLLCCLRLSKKSSLSFLCSVFSKVSAAALNFLVVQIYADFSYVVFFSILQFISLSLKSAWSDVSFVFSLIFMILGLCLLGLHCTFLVKYRRLKSRVSTELPHSLEDLVKKYSFLAVLYKDFSNKTLFKHSYLFILDARNITISILVTTMLSMPLFESGLMICCSALMCIYLIFSNPFCSRFEQVSQLFLEMCVLSVYICVLCLALFGTQDESLLHHREKLELAIITINIILKFGCILLMSLQIIQLICRAYKDYTNKRKLKSQVVVDVSMLNEINNSQIHMRSDRANSFVSFSTIQPKATGIEPQIAQINSSEPLGNKQIRDSHFLEDSYITNKASNIFTDNGFNLQVADSNHNIPPKLVAARPLDSYRCTIKSREIFRPISDIDLVEDKITNFDHKDHHDLFHNKIKQRQNTDVDESKQHHAQASKLIKDKKTLESGQYKQANTEKVSQTNGPFTHREWRAAKAQNYKKRIDLPGTERNREHSTSHIKRGHSIVEQELFSNKNYLEVLHEQRARNSNIDFAEYQQKLRANLQKETEDSSDYAGLRRIKEVMEAFESKRLDSSLPPK